MAHTDVPESKRWHRQFHGEFQKLIAPPEEVWPFLDLVEPQVIPDPTNRRFVIRVATKDGRHHAQAEIPLVANTVEVWKAALGFMLDTRIALETMPPSARRAFVDLGHFE